MFLLACLLILPLLAFGEPQTRQNDTQLNGHFSVFNVVKFGNNPCHGVNNKTGTCYTKLECDEKGGFPSGSCASSFGVCCIVNIGCDSVSSENNTYLSGSLTGSGSCKASFCPKQDVCQIRIDFLQYTVTDPRSLTMDYASVPVSQSSQCYTEMFTVSSGSEPITSRVCGPLTGMHMFVEPDPSCNSLTLSFGSGAPLTGSRNFEMKISSFSCDYEHLAPTGCTQYYYGEKMGSVKTFNYQGQELLANHNQMKVCVRRERNVCKLCWMRPMPNELDLQISDTSFGTTFTPVYGRNLETGPDCLIPGAATGRALKTPISRNSQVTTQSFFPACQHGDSFQVPLMTDPFNLGQGGEHASRSGFQLNYIQKAYC